MFDRSIPLSLQYYIGKPDKLTSQWFPLTSPIYTITIYAIYFTSLIMLHKVMKQRKAFSLRMPLIVHNAFQVCLSVYICKEVGATAYHANYKLSCTPVNTSTKDGARMAAAFWLFYISKVFDLIDTIFFVLRKKQNQITFLHIYHHTSMLFNWYIGVLYSPGGQAFMSVLINSFVHVVMYTYYMLAAMGPRMKKYLWWKRYLTQLQLVQFLIVMGHLHVGLYNKCRAPYWLNCFSITYIWTMVILFANFYYKAYRSKVATSKGLPGEEDEDVQFPIDYGAGGDFKCD